MTGAGIDGAKFSTRRIVLSAATYLLELAIIGVGYIGVADAALLLPAINAAATPLWPPTGLALGLVLLRGYRIWPALFLGSAFASAISSGQMAISVLPASASVGIATTLAAVVGAWLTNRWSEGRETFASALGIARFALISIVTAMIGAALAVASRLSFNGFSFADPFVDTVAIWTKWWLVDAAGIVLITPVILLWANTLRRSLSASTGFETAAIIGITAAIGVVASSTAIGRYLDGLPPYRDMFAFLIFLPLIWAGLHGNQRDAATAALIFCAVAVWELSTSSNPSAAAELNGSLILLVLLSVSALLASLIIGATISAYHDTEARLLSANSQLTGQLEQARSAFKSLKRHLDIFVESVADYVILVLDRHGHVATWNGNAEKIIGYTADEIVGKHYGLLYRPDGRRAGEPNRALEFATQNGGHEVEGWRIRKNGTPFFVTGTLTAIRGDDGDVIGFAHVIRDATERRDAQEKLVEAREQLVMAQKMEAIGKLTGGIAHDFNNLLMIIGGNAQIFKRLLDPKLPRAIEAIQTAAKRGEGLTRQLLTFSRRQHLSPTIVDLKVGIKNMRTLIESSLRGNIVYNEQINADVWPVKVDIAELELAIVNIAVNARDAMPNGGKFSLKASNVRAHDERDGERHTEDFVAVALSDTGMGIPPSLLSKIFDPFFTTKEVGKGTGLGLSQVYGFAHQAGGTVQAESTVGVGTTITVYLPSCAGEEIFENEIEIDAARSQRPLVLVVDDSTEVAEVTSSLFEQLGYDTIYRESAEAALNLLAEGAHIDLVFSDIVMPGMIDGVGLANELRSRYPNLPVILTTGYSDAAKAAPSDLKILHKPFDSDTLKSFIKDMAGIRQASQ
jgi:PAS domain S-box-containing protein